jgi:hypothetical protein
LNQKCRGNVDGNGIVSITASSDSSGKAKNIANLRDPGSYFMSSDSAGSWICYDFKNMTVTPTHYSLESYPFSGPKAAYPRTWAIEASNDNRNWTTIDERRNRGELCGKNQIGTFEVAKSVTCRFIRLRQTGNDSLGRDYLAVSAFELFGTLTEYCR